MHFSKGEELTLADFRNRVLSSGKSLKPGSAIDAVVAIVATELERHGGEEAQERARQLRPGCMCYRSQPLHRLGMDEHCATCRAFNNGEVVDAGEKGVVNEEPQLW